MPESFELAPSDDQRDSHHYHDVPYHDADSDSDQVGLDTDSPDAPLTASSPPPSGRLPKWLNSSSSPPSASPWRSYIRHAATLLATLGASVYSSPRLRSFLRPRLTWRYVTVAFITAYLFLCLIRGQPPLASPLPDYHGPHAVGTMDLEIPLHLHSHGDSSSSSGDDDDGSRQLSNVTLKKTGQPAFAPETVLMSLYYPAQKGVKSPHPRHRWIPRPVSATASGYAQLLHLDNVLIRPIFTFALWALAGSIEIPAEVDVPLLTEVPSALSSSSNIAGDDDVKFPLMVFSHGMASTRTDYTAYLGSIASHGYIVAAIEHRDGSSPGSIVHPPPPSQASPGSRNRNAPYQPPMLHESDLLLPNGSQLSRPQLKREQLALRNLEIQSAINILISLDSDSPSAATEIHNSNTHPLREGASLPSFTNRIDSSFVLICGHSYGATTALHSLLPNATATTDPTTTRAKLRGGIILDPGKNSGKFPPSEPHPILTIHSASWSRTHSLFYGRPHFSVVKDLVIDTLRRTGASWFLTARHTSHVSVTDAPLIEPLLLRWTTGATVDVREGLREYVNVSLEFLQFLKGGVEQVRGTLLGEKVTHDEYDQWTSQERKRDFGKRAQYWQIHVSPVGFKELEEAP